MQKNNKIIIGIFLAFLLFSISLFGWEWRDLFKGWQWPNWSFPTLTTEQKIGAGIGVSAAVTIPPAYLMYRNWVQKKEEQEKREKEQEQIKLLRKVTKDLRLKNIPIDQNYQEALDEVKDYLIDKVQSPDVRVYKSMPLKDLYALYKKQQSVYIVQNYQKRLKDYIPIVRSFTQDASENFNESIFGAKKNLNTYINLLSMQSDSRVRNMPYFSTLQLLAKDLRWILTLQSHLFNRQKEIQESDKKNLYGFVIQGINLLINQIALILEIKDINDQEITSLYEEEKSIKKHLRKLFIQLFPVVVNRKR